MATFDPAGRSVSRDAARDTWAPTWLGEVTAVAAHELGNSVTALTFALDLLRERHAAGSDRRDLDEMRGVLDQASNLVRLLARLSSSGTAAVPLDLRAVVADAAPLLQRLATRSLRISLSDGAVPVVAARSEIERALVEMTVAIFAAGGRNDALTLAVDASGRALVVMESAPVSPAPQRPDPLDPASLPCAHALAAKLGGTLHARRLANGALRIELALPSGIR